MKPRNIIQFNQVWIEQWDAERVKEQARLDVVVSKVCPSPPELSPTEEGILSSTTS